MGRKETKDGRNGGGGSKVDAGDLKVGVYLYRRQSTLDVAIRRSRSPARTSLLFLFLPMQEAAYENAVSQLIPGKQPEQATLMTDLPRPRRLICSLVTGLVLMMGYID